MKKMKVYFDLDGVLSDFERGVEELCHIPFVPRGRTAEEDDLMWKNISEYDHFYYDLKPIDGAIEMFNEARKLFDCEILSAVPKPKRGVIYSREDKTKWVQENLGENVVVNLVGSAKEKKDFCKGKNCVLVDDLEGNIEDWNKAGGKGILFKSSVDALKKLRSLNIEKDSRDWLYHVRKEPFKCISEGTKIYELRLYDEKRQELRENDYIYFIRDNDTRNLEQVLSDYSMVDGSIIKTRVIEKHRFSSFEELFSYIEPKKCGFDDLLTPVEAAKAMGNYYTKDEIDRYGVVAIELCLL